MKLLTWLLIMAVQLVLAGCERSAPVPSAPSKDHSSQLSVLQSELSKLSKRLDKIEAESLMRLINEPGDSVTFDPQESTGYGRLVAPTGVLLIKLSKIEPYLDGFALTFMIGNPTTATYSGVEGEISWAPAIDWNKPETMDKFTAKKFKIQDRFPAGMWSPMKITVGPAKPEDVRRVTVKPSFNVLSMREPA